MVYTFWYLQIALFLCSTWNEMLKKQKQTYEEYVHINSVRIIVWKNILGLYIIFTPVPGSS